MADYRILHEDPSYERIRGLRRARSFGFFAKLFGWLCILSVFPGIPLILPFIQSGDLPNEAIFLPVVIFIIWLVCKLVSKFLYTKYME